MPSILRISAVVSATHPLRPPDKMVMGATLSPPFKKGVDNVYMYFMEFSTPVIIMQHDRTRTAIQRQLKGMGLDLFEVSIIRGDEHRSVNLWTPAEILERLPNLKRANLAGAHIYVRGPRDRDHDLILLDDLNRFTFERMKAAGHDPAVTVETSPGSVQAWLRLGHPISAEVRHEVCRYLAKLYGGDPGAIDPHQSGRIAGFTNRKPQYKSAKGFPFVLMLSAPGKVAPASAELIRAAKVRIWTDLEKQQSRIEKLKVDASEGEAADNLISAWEREYKDRGGDLSNVDFAICCQVLKAGYEPDNIAAALEAVADRKGRHARAYAERTVRAAVRSLSPDMPDLS